MADHNALIDKLSRTATPIHRVLPAGMRVASWVLMALPAGVMASFLLEREATDWTQSGAGWAIAQAALVFAMGLFAISQAFIGSIAGREPLGRHWLLMLLIVWLSVAAMSLGEQPLSASSLHDTHCYTFMVTVSVPMIALALAFLRHTRTFTPVRSLLLAGSGVACMALTLLSFCHPVHVHPEDFLMHLAAIVTIVAATVAIGWRWVRVERS